MSFPKYVFRCPKSKNVVWKPTGLTSIFGLDTAISFRLDTAIIFRLDTAIIGPFLKGPSHFFKNLRCSQKYHKKYGAILKVIR